MTREPAALGVPTGVGRLPAHRQVLRPARLFGEYRVSTCLDHILDVVVSAQAGSSPWSGPSGLHDAGLGVSVKPTTGTAAGVANLAIRFTEATNISCD